MSMTQAFAVSNAAGWLSRAISDTSHKMTFGDTKIACSWNEHDFR
jgi:hypothetical protein